MTAGCESRPNGDHGLRRVPAIAPATPGCREALWVGAAAVVVRLIYLLQYLRSPLSGQYRIDQLYYRTWGIQIAGGDWFGGQESFEQSPGTPTSWERSTGCSAPAKSGPGPASAHRGGVRPAGHGRRPPPVRSAKGSWRAC